VDKRPIFVSSRPWYGIGGMSFTNCANIFRVRTAHNRPTSKGTLFVRIRDRIKIIRLGIGLSSIFGIVGPWLWWSLHMAATGFNGPGYGHFRTSTSTVASD